MCCQCALICNAINLNIVCMLSYTQVKYQISHLTISSTELTVHDWISAWSFETVIQVISTSHFMHTHRTDGQLQQPNRLAELPDNKGWTPLHYACYDNNMKLVLQLINAGADPNAKYVWVYVLVDRLRKHPVHCYLCNTLNCRSYIYCLSNRMYVSLYSEHLRRAEIYYP